MLVSLYGLLGDSAQPTAYSTNGKTAQQIEAMRSIVIRRPAITVLGLSTPETFYDALSQDDVANGFLNRLIVVNSREEERVEDPKSWKPVPRELKEWLFFYGSNDDEDFIKSESSIEVDPPVTVKFTSGANELLREIAEEVIRLKKRYRAYRLDGMFSRTRENAMRIALIVAKSQDLTKVNEKSLQWAWDYVLFYAMETVRATQDMMGSSPIIRIAEHLAQVIEDSGKTGAMLRDLQRKSADFKRLSQRDTDEVLYRLTTRHRVVAPKVDVKSVKGGRPTSKFYHINYAPKESK